MPKRIQLRRTKGWRKPEGAVVVARPTRWGNPFYAGDRATVSAHQWGEAGHFDLDGPVGFSLGLKLTPEIVVDLYRQCLVGNLADADPRYDELRSALEELRGCDLACWCDLSSPCHADVLLEVANGEAA